MNTQLNYHHLRYFFAVAEAGGIAGAARQIAVSPPTLSAQISEFEAFLGTPLFQREHRRMTLTETGRIVRRYAERIILLGDELVEVVTRGGVGVPERTLVGITDSVPKLIAARILESALATLSTLRVIVREGLPSELVPALAAHQLDLVIANEPAPSSLRTILHSRKIGSFAIDFMASPSLKARFRRASGLDDFPVLLPTRESPLRRQLDATWHAAGIVPRVVGEFDDTATMFELAAAATGAVPVLRPAAKSVAVRYGLVRLAISSGVTEDLFLITPEREFQQLGAAAISDAASRALR